MTKLNRLDEITQIERAIAMGKVEYKGIKLPLPQRYGTITQQRMYIEGEAIKVYNTLYNIEVKSEEVQPPTQTKYVSPHTSY